MEPYYIYIIPMHAFIIQYFVPDFNLYFLSFHSIFIVQYFIKWIYHNIFIDFTVGGNFCRVWCFAIIQFHSYGSCIYPVYVWGLAWREYKPSTFGNNTKPFFKVAAPHLSSHPQFITIPLVLHPHQHLNC